MKKLLISAFAICLATVAPTALWAAQDDHPDKGKTHESSRGSSGGSSGQYMHGSGGGAGKTDSHGSGGGAGKTKYDRTYSDSSGDSGRKHHGRTRTDTSGGMSGPTDRHSNMDRHGDKGHAAVDLSRFHRNVDSERHFHWGDYHGPEGYSYRRWGFGDRLPQIYWARDYWITSYLNFGLDVPPDNCVWVRYGPDALLIDEDTGEVVEVVYGVFY